MKFWFLLLFANNLFAYSFEFSEHNIKHQGKGFINFQSVDIDNDGDVDFFPSYNFNANNSKLKFYENQDGFMSVDYINEFDGYGIVKFAQNSTSGLVDIYSNNVVNNTFYLHRQVSAGSFQKELFFQHPPSIFDGYEVLDVNNDSNADVLLYEYDSTNNIYNLVVYINSNGVFNKIDLDITLDNPTIAGYRELYLTDMNSDGFVDILLLQDFNGFRTDLVYLKNDGQSGFVKTIIGETVYLSHAMTNVRNALTIFDTNNDGLLDVYFPFPSVQGFNTVGFIEQSSEDVFNSGSFNFNIFSNAKIHLKDQDNDGDLDIFTMNYSYPKLRYYKNDNGNYTKFDLHGGGSRSSEKIEFIDLDNDGLFDIVSSEDNQIHKYKQTSSLVFEKQAMSNEVIGSKFIKGINFSNANHKDLISVSPINSNLSLYLNDGNENFNSLQLDGTESNISGLDVYDYNNDSLDDIIIVAKSTLDNSMGVIWYENINNQLFTKHFISTLSGDNGDFYFVDIDNDGDVDLFQSRYGDSSWYENIAGVYQSEAPINYNTGQLYLVDFDNDGDFDVLSSGTINSPFFSYSSTYWMEMDNGTFTKNMIEDDIDYSVFQPVDLDGDGNVEILVRDDNNDTFLWIKNGVGFTKLPFNEFSLRSSMNFKDMNNDNLLDRVTGASIYYNMGNFQFQINDFYDLSTSNFDSLLAGYIEDINNDGLLDIVASTSIGDFFIDDPGLVLLKQTGDVIYQNGFE